MISGKRSISWKASASRATVRPSIECLPNVPAVFSREERVPAARKAHACGGRPAAPRMACALQGQRARAG